jgi:DNA-binding transcriptional LysR family regulator
MHLETLRTFVELVERGSFSAAARRLGISQPAISKQLQRLEAELEAPLLIRDTLARYDQLRGDLAALQQQVHGGVRVAASTIPGEYLLPGLLAAFQEAYPQVKARLIIAGTSDVVDKLVAGEADVGFIGAAVDEPGLNLEPIGRDEIVLAVPAGHAFAQRDVVSPAKLAGEALILREPGSGTRLSVEAALERAGQALPAEANVLVLGSTAAVIQAVEEGLGVGFVSSRAVAQRVAARTLAWVRLEDVDLGRPLYLASLQPSKGAPPVQAFHNFAREWIRAAADAPG